MAEPEDEDEDDDYGETKETISTREIEAQIRRAAKEKVRMSGIELRRLMGVWPSSV